MGATVIEASNGCPAAMLMPLSGPELESLQGSFRHFISPEAFKAYQARQKANASTSSQDARLQKTATHKDSTRLNVVDYLVWLNVTMRLIAARRNCAVTRMAEKQCEAVQADCSDTLADLDVELDPQTVRLLSSLPNVHVPLNEEAHVTHARASNLEKQVESLLSGRQPRAITSFESFTRQTVLHPIASLLPPLHTKQDLQPVPQLRYETASFVNTMFGDGTLQDEPALVPVVTLEGVTLPEPIWALRGVSIFTPDREAPPRSTRIPSFLQHKFAAEEASMVETPEPSSASAVPNLLPYRIVHGENIRKQARILYAKPILSLPATRPWCAPHRVQHCSVCRSKSTTPSPVASTNTTPAGSPRMTSRTVNTAASNETSTALIEPPISARSVSKRRRTLASAIPQFIILSAELFDHFVVGDSGERPTRAFSPSPKWFSLLASLITQACLEGYLLNGWSGKDAMEVLFGVGCGVWDEKDWGQDMPKSVPSPLVDQAKLVKASRRLFAHRTVVQAEFEREMHDRLTEFLNATQAPSLEAHLTHLNAKYPLSFSEDVLFGFLHAAQTYLGLPKLAKYGEKTERSNSLMHDRASLEQYISLFPETEAEQSQATYLVDVRPGSKRKAVEEAGPVKKSKA